MEERTDEFDHIGMDVDDDILFTTIRKYKLFLSYAEIGMDAQQLYTHLMFTCKLQKSNSIKANNVYLRGGLHWGKERLQKAMNLLYDLDLCERITRRGEDGLIQGHYLVVKAKQSPMEITDIDHSPPKPHVDGTTGGFQPTNALTNNNKCLNNSKIKKAKDIQPSAVAEIRQCFQDIGSTYYHDGKEAKMCKLLESRYKADPIAFKQMLKTFKRMRENPKEQFYSKQPLSPSAVVSLWNKIKIELEGTTPPVANPPPSYESWEDYIYRIRRELVDAGWDVSDITLDSDLDAVYTKFQAKRRKGELR